MIKRFVVALALLTFVTVAQPVSAKSWKSTKKVDPAAGRAAIKAMNRSLSQGVVYRAKNSDRDPKNSFRTRGRASGSKTSVSGEWNFDLALDGKLKSKARPVNVSLSADGGTISADYDAVRVDFLFPVVYGVCGPKVGAGANVTGNVQTINNKSIASFYVGAGVDGQIGCGFVAKCPIAWIGGGMFAEGKAGVKACPSGSCLYSYVEGSLGPVFEAKLACLTMFSWKESWTKEYYLGVENL
jgi:hypothetical protein